MNIHLLQQTLSSGEAYLVSSPENRRYLTEFSLSASAEDHAEYSTTFAINGTGAKGDVTVSAEQQKIASYVFADTNKTGA